MNTKNNERVYRMKFKDVYPLYINKVERKGKTKEEVDLIIQWLCGYSHQQIIDVCSSETTLESFFNNAPKINENASLIKGVICGVRVEEIEDPIIQKVRYLDKLVDELSKGRKMEKILRNQ